MQNKLIIKTFLISAFFWQGFFSVAYACGANDTSYNHGCPFYSHYCGGTQNNCVANNEKCKHGKVVMHCNK